MILILKANRLDKPTKLTLPADRKCAENKQSVLKTTDGGSTWESQVSGTHHVLNSVYFTTADTGDVAGDVGTIVKTTNGVETLPE